jgi:quinol monooxygenase YgiN
MIHATIRMKLPDRKVKEAMEILRSMAERARVEPGCISCRIYREDQEEHAILIEEFWRSQEDLERHLRSAEYRNVLLVVEMSQKEPEVKFHEIVGSSGLETIEKAISTAKAG